MNKKRSETNCLPHRELVLSDKYIENFLSKFEKGKKEECWVWKGYKNLQGYGRIGIAPSQCVNAHRFSWTFYIGPIPKGMFVCHKCDNPSCVNPNHLFIGTRQDNTNDMMVKKRSKHFQKNKFYGVVEEERYDGPNRKNRWRSFIVIDEKVIKLGAHTSILEAARNYDRIAYMKYRIKDKLNFPEEYDLSS